MFSLPPAPGELPEGQSEETPVVLEGLECHEFECFLSVLYPSDFSKANNITTKDWTPVLSLASKWDFMSIRQLAIHQLGKIASPAERIAVCIKYDVKDLLIPAYTELCTQLEPLNLEEGMNLGIRDTIFIGEVRWELRPTHTKVIAERIKTHLSTP